MILDFQKYLFDKEDFLNYVETKNSPIHIR